jgi:isopenicillin N synthase-like dioxygenase
LILGLIWRFHHSHAVIALGRRLFPLFALALNIDEHFFDDKVCFGRFTLGFRNDADNAVQTTKPAAIMRFLYYPPQTGPVDDRIQGIGAHTE